jgi:hypothetical protein
MAAQSWLWNLCKQSVRLCQELGWQCKREQVLGGRNTKHFRGRCMAVLEKVKLQCAKMAKLLRRPLLGAMLRRSSSSSFAGVLELERPPHAPLAFEQYQLDSIASA